MSPLLTGILKDVRAALISIPVTGGVMALGKLEVFGSYVSDLINSKTTIGMMLLIGSLFYLLGRLNVVNKTKINMKEYDFKDGLYIHKKTGKQYCQPCLLKGTESELTEYNLGPKCQNCGKMVGFQ